MNKTNKSLKFKKVVVNKKYTIILAIISSIFASGVGAIIQDISNNWNEYRMIIVLFYLFTLILFSFIMYFGLREVEYHQIKDDFS